MNPAAIVAVAQAVVPASVSGLLRPVAVLLSMAALVLSAFWRWRQTTHARQELAAGEERAANLASQCHGVENEQQALRTLLAGLRESLTRLARQQASARAVPDDSSSGDDTSFGDDNSSATDSFEVDPQIRQFIDLVRGWKAETRQSLPGAAAIDWATIDALTAPGSAGRDAAEQKAVFVAAARRLVEYAVIASGTGANPANLHKLSDLLDEMACLVGLKLIDPQPGQRLDPKLHESVAIVASAGNDRGTIASVELRGLVRSNGNVIRAKVYLYD